VGVPDEHITTEIDIRPYLDLKLQALAQHRSQFDFDESGQPKTFTTSLAEPERSQLFGVERFIRLGAAEDRSVDEQPERDLLGGLSYGNL